MTRSPRHIIGLTGLPSSGKGEVTATILALAEARGWTAVHLSFSARIKEEARARGIADEKFTRELLSQIAIEMRQAEGPGVLALRLAGKILDWPEPAPEVFVVEALRHVGELDAMKETFGDRFVLISVECDVETIARRLIARQRPDESPEALQSEDKAIRLLEKELKGKQSALGPNVGDVAERADIHLANSGSLEELQVAVGELFQERVG